MATAGTDLQLGLAYATNRADSRLDPLLTRLKATRWETYPIDMRRQIEPLRDLSALFQLRRAIRNFKPDIVHCHSSKAGALGRTATLLQSHPPVRLYTPNALAAPLGKHYLKIEQFISRYTDGFIAVSDSEEKEIRGFGLDRHCTVDIVYPLIDTDFFAPAPRDKARKAIGIDHDAPLVLGIGRLTQQKDPVSFVAIIKQLLEVRQDVRALWLGAGEGEAEFKRAIAQAGLDRVIRLVPWQHDVRPYIAAANVGYPQLLSRFESFGYMVAEALAMTIPAVATDVTGTCDIMRGELRDWLYPVRDHARAAQLLGEMLGDPNRADALGHRARQQIILRFSAEQMRRDLIGSYEDSLRRRGGIQESARKRAVS